MSAFLLDHLKLYVHKVLTILNSKLICKAGRKTSWTDIFFSLSYVCVTHDRPDMGNGWTTGMCPPSGSGLLTGGWSSCRHASDARKWADRTSAKTISIKYTYIATKKLIVNKV